jgi:hypothetical protein
MFSQIDHEIFIIMLMLVQIRSADGSHAWRANSILHLSQCSMLSPLIDPI